MTYDPTKPAPFVVPDREGITGGVQPDPGIFGVQHELRGAVNLPADFYWRSNPKQWQEENGTAESVKGVDEKP